MMPVASLDNSRILLIISEATSEHPSICRLAAGYSVSELQGCRVAVGRRRVVKSGGSKRRNSFRNTSTPTPIQTPQAKAGQF
jgi:hypothetical protein